LRLNGVIDPVGNPMAPAATVESVQQSVSAVVGSMWQEPEEAEIPMLVPGPRGATGAQGLMGPPGVDADPPDEPMFVLLS